MLGAILVIPLAIFIFLKIFGDNRFDIPVYYQEEGFLVADSLVNPPNLSLIYLSGEENPTTLSNNTQRLKETFGAELPQMITYSKDRAKDFKAEELVQYILIDGKRRIRGYYGADLEEMDRLIVEIKILIENGGDE